MALLPLDNRSGVDLSSQPGLFWRSVDVLRMLVQMEASEVELVEWPFAGVDPGVLPEEVAADSFMRRQLEYEPDSGVLRWREGMTREERDRLLSLTDDTAWRQAVGALYAESQHDRVDVAQLVLDAIEASLSQRGYTVHLVGEGSLPANATFAQRVDAVRESSGADVVLLFAIERWDVTGLFEHGEVRIEATAGLIDATSRALRWRNDTGPFRIRVLDSNRPDSAADSLNHQSVVDLRVAYPRIAHVLAERALGFTP